MRTHYLINRKSDNYKLLKKIRNTEAIFFETEKKDKWKRPKEDFRAL